MSAAGVAVALWLEIVLPSGFPPRETSSAVVCRMRDGTWGPVQWRTDAAPPARVEGPEGARCRVLVRPSGTNAYLASREVQWTATVQPLRVEPAWLRTIEAPPVSSLVTWLSADRDDAVECESRDDAARCWFVPASGAGVMAARGRDSILFAVVRAGPGGRVIWSGNRWARLVRVQSPAGSPVTGRAVTIERALSQGSGHLLEARAASGVSVTQISSSALWVDGDQRGGFLDLRAKGAGMHRVALDDVLASAPASLDLALRVEEFIEGDVRGRGRPAEGTTVVLSRVIDGEKPGKEDQQFERIAERRIEAGGTFRFDGLTGETYELLAIHSELGRARITVTPPAFPRLVLKPRSVIRGRVLENGVATPGARVQMLPSLEAVRAARNPLMLATDAATSGPDGRFEIIAPDEGQVILSVGTGRSAQRVDLGDAAALAEQVDLGDIKLEEPRALEVLAELPAGCTLRAAGPMGVAGLSIQSLSQTSAGRWRFIPPAGGRWLFVAVCGTKELPLDPAMVDIRPGHREAIVLKVRRRPVYF